MHCNKRKFFYFARKFFYFDFMHSGLLPWPGIKDFNSSLIQPLFIRLIWFMDEIFGPEIV